MSAGFVVKIVAVGIISLFASLQYARAGLSEYLNPKETVKDIIASFREQVSSLIAQAGSESRVTLLLAFQRSEALIGTLETAYEKSLDKTFDELDTQQRKAFEDTNKILLNAQSTFAKPVSDVTTTIDRLSTVINDVGNWSGKPTVTGYDPGYISPTVIQPEIRITVRGFKLHISERPPLLRIGNTEIQGMSTSNAANFVVPRAAFGNQVTGTRFVAANLVLAEDQSHWFWPPDWVWPRLRETKFGLLFTVLPDSLGSFAVVTRTRVTREETKPFVSDPPLETYGDTSGSGVQHECYYPTPGWKFAVSTARPVQLLKVGYYKNKQDDRMNHGEVGWYEDRVLPDQICLQVRAIILDGESAGRTRGRLEVQMVHSVDVDSPPAELPRENLQWQKTGHFNLQDDAISQIINIKLFDQIDYTQSATDSTELPFLRIQPDTRNKTVYLQPVRDWSAR